MDASSTKHERSLVLKFASVWLVAAARYRPDEARILAFSRRIKHYIIFRLRGALSAASKCVRFIRIRDMHVCRAPSGQQPDSDNGKRSMGTKEMC